MAESERELTDAPRSEYPRTDTVYPDALDGAKRELTDYEAAEAIRDGSLPSPTKYGDFWLFDLRVTGTGAAWRDVHQEWAFRDPELWTSDALVKRANGLPVIFEHPPESGLTSDEWKERAIGTIVLPYVKGEGDDAEVWGIAKVFDADAADLMRSGAYASTSPGVTPGKGSKGLTLENGDQVLAEGLPTIFDHLAVCTLGVWDKDGPAAGVRLDEAVGKGNAVAEKTVAELEKELEAANRRADAAVARADAAEQEAEKAREDAKRKDEDKEREDAARRKDEEDQEAIRAAEKAKDDARKKKHDEAKHDGMHNDCAKCDAAEKGEEEEKNDGAATETIDADREKQIADSKRHDSEIAQLRAKIASLEANNAPLSHDDAAALASAWHRADSIFPMLGEHTPRQYPGEKPGAYRRRLADSLRKFTATFKDEPIHDSLSGAAFNLIEDRIYAEALAEAKNPTISDSAGLLREIVTTVNGKTRREFVGDARVAWAPFSPQAGLKITKFNRPDNG